MRIWAMICQVNKNPDYQTKKDFSKKFIDLPLEIKE
jgi:hypothetical protein